MTTQDGLTMVKLFTEKTAKKTSHTS